MDDVTSARDFTEMLPRIDKFASGLSAEDRELFDRMLCGMADAIMTGFRAYSSEFGDAFAQGRTQLTVSYDANSPGITGKYSSRYIKPRYIKP
ncbi:hypothetical protein LWC34_01625 [Kibdelosporangium philippinense]|uniref:Uncharacterized protein n=1 Tax=Kibdelosporangium philippinense TaxID=211113 RepID=A0ABS8Z269_9PSEU|nr:hypothetical protein [Kibdelosporangium philippinense]MCE7001547.1 hypothetical protein [Kibdelosporangium philippinense]